MRVSASVSGSASCRDLARRPRAPPRRASPARPPAASRRDRAASRSRRGGRAAGGRRRPARGRRTRPVGACGGACRRSRGSARPRGRGGARGAGRCRRRLEVPTRAPRGRASSRGRRRRHQDVSRILARRERREHEAPRALGGQVLQAVDGQVHAPVQERLLDLLHEEALAADLGQMRRGEPVARGADRHQLDVEARPRAPETRRDLLGLAERQLAAARADADTVGHLASPSAPGAAGERHARRAGEERESVARTRPAAGRDRAASRGRRARARRAGSA